MNRTLQVLAGAFLVAASGATQAQTFDTKPDAVVPLGNWSYDAIQILENHARTLESQRRLQSIAAKLRPLFVGRASGTLIESDGADLVVRFHANREVDADGFLLRLSLREGGTSAPLLRPQEKPEPHWTIWQSEFRLNSRETDPTKIAATEAEQAYEHPDVPLGAWPYAAIETLAKVGIIEGLPNGNYFGYKPMTRYEFAVAVVRLLDKVHDKALTPLQATALAKPENQAALQALTGEFAGDLLSFFGESRDSILQLVAGTTFFIRDPRIRHEILQMQLSYGRDTDAALLQSIKRAINDWALEEMRTALALPEGQPKKP